MSTATLTLTDFLLARYEDEYQEMRASGRYSRKFLRTWRRMARSRRRFILIAAERPGWPRASLARYAERFADHPDFAHIVG